MTKEYQKHFDYYNNSFFKKISDKKYMTAYNKLEENSNKFAYLDNYLDNNFIREGIDCKNFSSDNIPDVSNYLFLVYFDDDASTSQGGQTSHLG